MVKLLFYDPRTCFIYMRVRSLAPGGALYSRCVETHIISVYILGAIIFPKNSLAPNIYKASAPLPHLILDMYIC